MVQLVSAGLWTAGPQTHVTGITDLVAVSGPQGLRVYSTSGPDGGILVWDGGTGSVLDTSFHPASASLGPPLRLAWSQPAGGAATLWSYGLTGQGAVGHALLADGTLGASSVLATGAGAILSLLALPSDSALRLVMGIEGQSGPVAWTAASGLAAATTGFALPAAARPPDDLAQLDVGGQRVLVALSSDGAALAAFALGADSAARQTDSFGRSEGLAVGRPSALAAVDVPWGDFVLVSDPQTSSISVLQLLADQTLRLTDQVTDSLTTRFQTISALETVLIGDRVFVLAAGVDDGLSLLTLLPGGRLLHLASLPDTVALALEDVQALAATAEGGRIRAFAASGDRPGLNHLTFDPGPLAPVRSAPGWGGRVNGDDRNDLLAGRGGADTLNGGAGNDILIDSGGEDVLSGGTGADVFVLVADGRADRITDFEAGIDRLDLSDWGRIYDRSALGFTTLTDGLEIRFGTETLRLTSAAGTPIAPEALGNGDLFDLTHIGLNLPRDPARLVTGGAGRDTLSGGNGADTLVGAEGGDQLSGEAGADLLLGDGVDARFDPAAASVQRLYLAVLGREAEPAGLLNWVGHLLAGRLTLEQTAAQFVTSAEFQATYGAAGSAEFVELLYRNVLGRLPDPAGFAHWVGLLDSGAQDRAKVVLGFSESLEFRARTLAQTLEVSLAGRTQGWSDDVFRLYEATLDRLPDPAGLAHWSGLLARGATLEWVAAGFIGSAEFQRIYGSASNSDLVRLLYANVLDRPPDPAGFAHWTGLLDSGAFSRERVVLGFSQSAEFRLKTAAAQTAHFRAGTGDDRLIGGDGNDTLFGGTLSDTFVFHATMDGADLVVGLEDWDRIALQGFGYATPAEALARFSEQGGQAVFADQGVQVTFHETPLARIMADMLLLV